MPRPLTRTAATLWMLAMLVVFWSPSPPNPTPIPGLDKVIHAVAFAGFGALAAWEPWGPWGSSRRWPVVAIGVGLALATEWVQGLLPWPRSAELGDVVADVVGLLIGVYVAKLVSGPPKSDAARGGGV